MTAATAISIVLAALLVFAAGRKLTHSEPVVSSYAQAGVPEERLNLLAVVLLAGAGGLLLGLAWRPIGIAAAACLVAYFATAVGFHLRHSDARNAPTPVLMLALAIASLVLLLAQA